MPQRVVVVLKQPQHDISRCGCFSNARTRCSRFSAHWAFSIFERNIYITVASMNMQVVICGRLSSVYCIVDFSSNTLSCSPAAFTRRVTVRRGCYGVLFWLDKLGR